MAPLANEDAAALDAPYNLYCPSGSGDGSLRGDTMNEYEPQHLHEELQAYFNRIRPLLNVIAARTVELGIYAAPAS